MKLSEIRKLWDMRISDMSISDFKICMRLLRKSKKNTIDVGFLDILEDIEENPYPRFRSIVIARSYDYEIEDSLTLVKKELYIKEQFKLRKEKCHTI